MNQERIIHPSSLRLLLAAILAVVSVLAPLQSLAQEQSSPAAATRTAVDRAELHQALLDLTNPWTVMCVAAHPDDEDGTTLTMLRRKYGVHTVSLFSTYGEGGQNAVGPELYQELGVIRAHETMAAAEIQGSEPYFLGLSDFGFTKSAEETFRVWGEKEALQRMVLKIRQLRPDVIITNHNTVSGHGQHQATGRLILQAFDAAADPKSFPEQLKQVTVWQPQRLFVRFGFESNPSTKALEQEAERTGKLVTVNPNEKDPVRGTSFAELALTALQQHATQGPWPKSIAERLRAQDRTELPLIRYRLAREVPSATGLPVNSKSFVEGLRLPVTTGAKLASPTVNGQPLTDFIDRPQEALVALVNARRTGAFTAPEDVLQMDRPRFQRMSARLDRALAVVSGASLKLEAKDDVLVPGIKSELKATLGNSGDTDIHVKAFSLSEWDRERPVEIAEKLPAGTDTEVAIKVSTPPNAAITVPAAEHLYDDRFLGERLVVNAKLEIEGAPFSVSAETWEPVSPAIEIKRIQPVPYVRVPKVKSWSPEWLLDLTLTNHLNVPFKGQIMISGPTHIAYEAERQIDLQPNETFTGTVHLLPIPPPREALRDGETSGFAQFWISAKDPQRLIAERRIAQKFVNAQVVPNLHVGYLPSFDKSLAYALAAFELEAKELTVKDIQESDLSRFDTIIIDNRGYQAHPELIAANQKLLDYVSQGGTLIVFYHKTNEWNPDEKKRRPQLAPYSIILADDRVTEEDAPVKLLNPAHPLLRFPNKIGPADFKDWIQERGLYYPKEWDPHYDALLSMSDEGEPALRGGLLVAKYGKGNYIYTSIVWYRQLMAGVPGAYRMFANMISYGRR